MLKRWQKEAEDGDAEAAYQLGEFYLKKAIVTEPEGSSALPCRYAVSAIEWILKASRLGHQKATQSLKDCLNKQIGEFLGKSERFCYNHELVHLCVCTLLSFTGYILMKVKKIEKRRL